MKQMSMIETLRTMGAQMMKGANGIARRREIYEAEKQTFHTNTHVWFWRNNVTFQRLLLQASLAILRPTPDHIGPTVQKWRAQSAVAQMVTRCFMETVIDTRKAVTISEVEVMTERLAGVGVSRDTVAKVLDDGVALGLLEQIGNSSQYKYVGTDLYWNECFDRATYKFMQPEVRRFADAASALHMMHDVATMTHEGEMSGKQFFDPNQSVQENLANGTYVEAAKMLSELEESDLLDLIDQIKDKTAAKK